MVVLPSVGVTVPVRKKNKFRFTESSGQKRVVFTREKGSCRSVRGTYDSGNKGPASTKVPRQQWVRGTSIPAVKTSPKKFLLNMESVCS